MEPSCLVCRALHAVGLQRTMGDEKSVRFTTT